MIVKFGEYRLVIKQLQLRWRTSHVQINHTLGFARKVWRSWFHGIERSQYTRFWRGASTQQSSSGKCTETSSAFEKKMPARNVLKMFEGIGHSLEVSALKIHPH